MYKITFKPLFFSDDFDIDSLYTGLRDKLRDPEREVRQHALRVLIDVIPLTETTSLDEHMRTLVPDLLSNLSHSAPALRKSALDSLRKYLKHSRNYDDFLLKLISTEDDNVITAAPFVICRKTSDGTLKQLLGKFIQNHIFESYWKKLLSHNNFVCIYL